MIILHHTGVPIAYTFPNGLQSVNGSSSTGGCQPESCVRMPISSTDINGCDCPGSTPVSGVLIDGVIPSIDTTQHGTWASELFVVNKFRNEDSFMIGFQFSTLSLLRAVEVAYFDCPVWGAGLTAVTVYSSQFFLAFLTALSTNIGMLSLANDTDQGCTSFRTIFLPLQPTLLQYCFIEFTFGGSSIHPINWLHLAEIRFSDVDLAPATGSTPITGEFTQCCIIYSLFSNGYYFDSIKCC